MKCPVCKKYKKNTEEQLGFLENTGRCRQCDFKAHYEDMKREHHQKLQTKDSMDISTHQHNYSLDNEDEK